jgi:LuxR family transcriptional regulator
MNHVEKINHQLQRLVACEGWCFAVGLRIKFNHPTLLYQTYPEAWIAYYAKNGLLFADPAVRWGMTHTGICDWSDLASDDTAGVLKTAAEFGLVHGIAISVGDATTRSLGFFAHSKRKLTKAESELAHSAVAAMHEASEGVADMTPDELAPLLALNADLRRPQS